MSDGHKSQRIGAFGELVAALLAVQLGEEARVEYYPVGSVDLGLDGILHFQDDSRHLMVGLQVKTTTLTKPREIVIKSSRQLHWLLSFPGPLLLIDVFYQAAGTAPIVVLRSYRKLLEEADHVRRNHGSDTVTVQRPSFADSGNDGSERLDSIWNTAPILKFALRVYGEGGFEPQQPTKEFERALKDADAAQLVQMLLRVERSVGEWGSTVGEYGKARTLRHQGRFLEARAAFVTLCSGQSLETSVDALKICNDQARCCPHYEWAILLHEEGICRTSSTPRPTRDLVAIADVALVAAQYALTTVKSHEGVAFEALRLRTAGVAVGFIADALVHRHLADASDDPSDALRQTARELLAYTTGLQAPKETFQGSSAARSLIDPTSLWLQHARAVSILRAGKALDVNPIGVDWKSLKTTPSQMTFRFLALWFFQEAAMAYFTSAVNRDSVRRAAIAARECLERTEGHHRELAIEALVAVGKQ